MYRKLSTISLLLAISGYLQAAIPEPFILNSSGTSTVVRVLDDDLLQISFRHDRNSNLGNAGITPSEMVFKQDYAGPQTYQLTGNGFETQDLRVTFTNNCLNIVEIKSGNRQTATLCPAAFEGNWRGLTLQSPAIHSLYGLGQNWTPIDANLGGKVNGERLADGGFRTSGEFGNSFSNITYNNGKYAGGTAPNLQFPVMFAVGDAGLNYAILFDSKLKMEFNLNQSPWQVRNRQASETNLYYFSGSDLPNLRSDFMELVGRPPVPPKKVFGLWMSEFSYDNWAEVDDTINTLRNNSFPVDGLMLDIAWFGFKQPNQLNSGNSPMGDLRFDNSSFPNAASKIASLKADNIGLMTIEESYVSRWGNLGGSNYQGLLSRSGFERRCDNNQAIEFNKWFGSSGQIDWSNTAAGNWWHDQVRKPNIIDLGVMGHWTDLGEPETFDAGSCASNGQHIKDYHNIHNLLWSKSIYEGYSRNHSSNPARPFSLARAGTVGSQRFGAALWSGDIGGRLDHMNLHYNSQMHLSMAGVDYYSSDIGGFWRKADEMGRRDTALPANVPYSEGEMYSLWFANAAWLDIPLRPHGNNCGMPGATGNECIATETSPALIGNIQGNRANLRQRYELAPYYYSLAHRAYNFGEPVIAPVAFYFQNDRTLRGVADQKMIGKSLLVATATQQFAASRNVYLPAGTWYNYHSLEKTVSTGQTLANVSLWHEAEKQNRLPVYARAGAIIPLMFVDDQTRDLLGHRKDGSVHSELIAQVFPASEASEFTLYEDDGSSVASYDSQGVPHYQVRTTRISQIPAGAGASIQIDSAQGSYTGAVNERNNEIRYLLANNVSVIQLNGIALPALTRSQFNAANAQGWLQEGEKVFVRTGILPVSQSKTIAIIPGTGMPPACPTCNSNQFKRTVVFMQGTTQVGQDMFIRGGIDHTYAQNQLGLTCTASNKLCAIPIRHLNLRNATSAPWKQNDANLDWYGSEPLQSSQAQGSPLDWTTNLWPASWGPLRTVAVDGYGETPLNIWGAHYWMLEVEMDCSKTVDGWFELKSFISNGPGWEADVVQPGAPYVSKNHFAQCGKLNVFQRGKSAPVAINNL
ncbi:MAG TPA: TIM-barrel domain-containing protein [Cellvibrio sp.]|nr:TIM-barrel domain-containing protein [Cellvibrio sp.]